MKSLTNIAQIFIIVIIAILFSNPTNVWAQDGEVQAAGISATTIVGGEQADAGEWGWQVLVRPGNYLCGGSLVAQDWVLTAAHCVFDSTDTLFAADAINVTVGETNRSVVEGTEQHVRVDAVFAHEEYGHWSNDNDIALLHLATPVEMNDAIAIVPMLTNQQLSLVAEGTMATVTGWGTTAEGGFTSSLLMEVSVPMVSNEVCNSSYGIISDNMICAGYAEGGKDSCQGDSGGPLVVPDEDGKWYLAGVVSFGYGCARENFYGVYARVSQYTEWVQSVIDTFESERNSDTDSAAGNHGNLNENNTTENEATTMMIFVPVVMN